MRGACGVKMGRRNKDVEEKFWKVQNSKGSGQWSGEWVKHGMVFTCDRND